MNTFTLIPRRPASALVVAMICVAIIAAVCAVTLSFVQGRYLAVHRTAAWKESLLASEAGIELATNEIRKSLYDPTHAWEEWRAGTDPALFPPSAEGEPTTVTGAHSLTSEVLLRQGESGLRSWASVTVDAPAFLRDGTGEQWFRIRSLGVTELPGGRIAGAGSGDATLRKFDLRRDRRTGEAVSHPRAARLVEAVVKPVGAFRLALLGIVSVDMTDHNIVIDSFDSRDSAQSTNGRYDPAKRQADGDVATNGELINAGNANIYGDALTNGGTVLNTDNVHGEVRDDFYQEIFQVVRPEVTPAPGSPGFIEGDATLAAQSGLPANYVLSGIALAGDEVLRIEGAENGSATYAQIVVTGDISLTGQSQIVLDPGVHVRFFLEGDADLAGKGILNTGTAANLQIYGVDRPVDSDGELESIGSIKIAGSSEFCGGVYAPNYDVVLAGGGKTGASVGAFVGYTIRLTGTQSVHYDEALAESGLICDYKLASWFEDEK